MVSPGEEMDPLSRRVTQVEIDAYAAASGDRNPIHLDAAFAASAGLPGTIAHGMLEMGILADAVARWAGGSDRVRSLSCRFSKPLVAGDTITCTGRVVSAGEGLATVELEAVSDRGARVLTHGRAVVQVEGP